MILLGGDDHSHAVILSALIFPQKGKLFGVEETRMRIEHPQHSGDGALVDRFVHVYLVGIVTLNDVQNAREVAHGGLVVVRRGRRCPHIGTVNASQYSR